MRVGYARVSSLEQARDSSALEQQQARLQAAGCDLVFVDVQSGTRDDRPQLRKALASLTPHDELVATRLDRLTRSPSFNEQLLTRFSADGAPGLRFLDDGLNMREVGGRMTARFLAAMAAAEVERLAERTAHGRAHRQAKGGHSARPPWAFLRSPDGLTLVVDPELEAVARGVIDHFLQHRSYRELSAWLATTHGLRKNKNALKRWLRNPALAGGIGRAAGTVHVVERDGAKVKLRRPPEPGVYDSIEWDRFPSLISRDAWDEIQRAVKVAGERGGGAHRGDRQRTWISGRFRCSGCGNLMYRHWAKLRCTTSYCDQRFGAGSLSLELAKASLTRGLEWMGTELAHQLAPVVAAAESREPATSPEIQKLQQEIELLRSTGISGLEELIAQKEQQAQALVLQQHGQTVTAAQALARMLPLLQRPWTLSDEELTQLLDDVEAVATVGSGGWVVKLDSQRFGCSWTFDPSSRRETFRIDLDSPLKVEQEERLGVSTGPALGRIAAWWGALDDEIDRRRG
jgi:DNA invertase Pin-like site-specific DNA recombinase